MPLKSHSSRNKQHLRVYCILILVVHAVALSSISKKSIFGVERAIDIPNDIFPTPDELKRMDEQQGAPFQRGWFDSCYKGAKLHYRKWLPETKPKAIIVFAHGIQTHGGNGMVLDDGHRTDSSLRSHEFTKAGYAVYAHDMYAHGFSEGTRWLIPQSWKNNLADYCTFVNMVAAEHEPDIPIILMGESYGSCLTIHLARQFQDQPDTGPPNFDSVILCGSAIDADLPPLPVRLVLRRLLAPLFPKWTPFFMPNPVSADRIWRDETISVSRRNLDGWKCGWIVVARPFDWGRRPTCWMR